MVDGRRKGNAFEVDVAYILSDWVCPLAGGWRASPMSPPFRRMPADKDAYPTDWVGGRDIIHVPHVYFPFSIECKKQEGWTIDSLLAKKTKMLLSWWEQTVAQATKLGLHPMLILARNRVDTLVVFPLSIDPGLLRVPAYLVTTFGEDSVRAMFLSDLVKCSPLLLHSIDVENTANAGSKLPPPTTGLRGRLRA